MREAIEAAAQQVEEVLGAIDLWVNNAMSRRGPLVRRDRTDCSCWFRVTRMNPVARSTRPGERLSFWKDLRAIPTASTTHVGWRARDPDHLSSSYDMRG
jgi:NAD(P)-dependent dehydrogenase (short-subunit alcohol dehydrogenase family)